MWISEHTKLINLATLVLLVFVFTITDSKTDGVRRVYSETHLMRENTGHLIRSDRNQSLMHSFGQDIPIAKYIEYNL